jgi:hypothetical protein
VRGRATRLVEANVSGLTNAEELQIDAAGPADRVLVGLAVGGDLGCRQIAPRDVPFCRSMSMWANRFSHMNRW